MSKKQVKTQGFVRKKKYRNVRAALNQIDKCWLGRGFDVKLSKRDGVWIALVSGGEA